MALIKICKSTQVTNKKTVNLTKVSRTASSLAPMYLLSSSGPYKNTK